jgi:acyl carrier protein
VEELTAELKNKIVAILELPEIRPEDIGDEDQLVGGDLGIDSVDVLELVIMLEEEYGVLIDNRELGEQVFRSVKTLAEYILQNRNK